MDKYGRFGRLSSGTNTHLKDWHHSSSCIDKLAVLTVLCIGWPVVIALASFIDIPRTAHITKSHHNPTTLFIPLPKKYPTRRQRQRLNRLLRRHKLDRRETSIYASGHVRKHHYDYWRKEKRPRIWPHLCGYPTLPIPAREGRE